MRGCTKRECEHDGIQMLKRTHVKHGRVWGAHVGKSVAGRCLQPTQPKLHRLVAGRAQDRFNQIYSFRSGSGK
jgi:hypothetical protein